MPGAPLHDTLVLAFFSLLRVQCTSWCTVLFFSGGGGAFLLQPRIENSQEHKHEVGKAFLKPGNEIFSLPRL